MKNDKSLMGLMLIAGIAFTASPAFAEIIYGRVTGVDAQSGRVTINRLDSSSSRDVRTDVYFANNVRYGGNVRSLNDLAVGETVYFDANRNAFTRQWSARAVANDQSSLSGRVNTNNTNNTNANNIQNDSENGINASGRSSFDGDFTENPRNDSRRSSMDSRLDSQNRAQAEVNTLGTQANLGVKTETGTGANINV